MPPVCATLPSSMTATLSPSRRAKPKFCSTTSSVAAPSFSSAKASIMLAMIAGASPLVGSSISSRRRGSTIARATASICFWPPDRLPAGRVQKRFSASKRAKIQSSRCGSGGPERAARTRFSCTVRSAKIAMLSGT